MVKLRYVGVMAKGLAVCVNYKIGVERNKVYDVPSSASKYFLATKNWEKENAPKEKDSKVKEEKKKEEEVEEKFSFNKDDEEVE